MREKIIAGNWKMNTCVQDGALLARSIAEELEKHETGDRQVILCPPFTHMGKVYDELTGSGIHTGAQDCSPHERGAYTGEVSTGMIASAGAAWVIIGHSERRQYHDEKEGLLLQKTRSALQSGLRVIFCCGEQLPDRDKGRQEQVVEKQLNEVVFQLTPDEFRRVVIAYEPVWAIGTGKTATPEQAQEMHSFIRGLIRSTFDGVIAEGTSLLYGGSCKPSNARDLFRQTDIDGGLIGGASLKAGDFCAVVLAME